MSQSLIDALSQPGLHLIHTDMGLCPYFAMHDAATHEIRLHPYDMLRDGKISKAYVDAQGAPDYFKNMSKIFGNVEQVISFSPEQLENLRGRWDGGHVLNIDGSTAEARIPPELSPAKISEAQSASRLVHKVNELGRFEDQDVFTKWMQKEGELFQAAKNAQLHDFQAPQHLYLSEGGNIWRIDPQANSPAWEMLAAEEADIVRAQRAIRDLNTTKNHPREHLPPLPSSAPEINTPMENPSPSGVSNTPREKPGIFKKFFQNEHGKMRWGSTTGAVLAAAAVGGAGIYYLRYRNRDERHENNDIVDGTWAQKVTHQPTTERLR